MAGLALLAQLVEHLHGKEGVSGSSPEEGFTKIAAKGTLFKESLARARLRGSQVERYFAH